MSLPKNVGQSDKFIRYTVAISALILSLFTTGSYSTFLFVVGVAIAATAYFGYCGLYSLLGINTCPMKKVTTHKAKKVVKKSLKKSSKKKAK